MNKKLNLRLIEIIAIIICLITIGIFTYVFRLEKSDLRYLFLVIDVFTLYNLYKVLKKIENKDNDIRVIKNSNNMIEAKYLRKISI